MVELQWSYVSIEVRKRKKNSIFLVQRLECEICWGFFLIRQKKKKAGSEYTLMISCYLRTVDIRKSFFTKRVVENWNRLPRELVKAPSLPEFSVWTMLSDTWSDFYLFIYWGEGEEGVLWGPRSWTRGSLPTQIFYDSMECFQDDEKKYNIVSTVLDFLSLFFEICILWLVLEKSQEYFGI